MARRSAFLDALGDWQHESANVEADITITERANVNVAEVSTFRGKQPMLADVMRRDHGIELPNSRMRNVGRDCAVISNGSNKWIFETLRTAHILRLKEALRGTAAVVDQTDGRCLLRIEGNQVERIFQKGLKIDIHRSVFTTNSVASTVIEDIAAHICRHADEPACFDVMISRSMAQSFWRWLRVATEEYRLRVTG